MRLVITTRSGSSATMARAVRRLHDRQAREWAEVSKVWATSAAAQRDARWVWMRQWCLAASVSSAGSHCPAWELPTRAIVFFPEASPRTQLTTG
jgi:hypothetical protein